MAKTRRPNDRYYQNKAKELFMAQFRGEPCAVCGDKNGTAGHHVVSQARSKALKFDKRNIIILCRSHHMHSNELAPHSSNQMAVTRFIEWFKSNHIEQYEWIKANERIERKFSYKQAWENLLVGREAWE
jgi:hypothetical protein